MTTFFANTNSYGSETSVGFANTNTVISFSSRKARDEYVAANSSRNLAVYPLTAKEGRKMADRDGLGRAVCRAANGEWVRI